MSGSWGGSEVSGAGSEYGGDDGSEYGGHGVPSEHSGRGGGARGSRVGMQRDLWAEAESEEDEDEAGGDEAEQRTAGCGEVEEVEEVAADPLQNWRQRRRQKLLEQRALARKIGEKKNLQQGAPVKKKRSSKAPE